MDKLSLASTETYKISLERSMNPVLIIIIIITFLMFQKLQCPRANKHIESEQELQEA